VPVPALAGRLAPIPPTVPSVHGRLAGWARWPGYGRNPLRRRIDRAETAARLTAGVLLLIAVPAAGITAGQIAENRDLARAQTAAAHSVQAVQAVRAVQAGLLAPAPAAGTPDPYANLAPKGGLVQAWVDAGYPVPAPADRSQVIRDVFAAVALAMLAVAVTLLTAMALIKRVLHRRRMNAWDAEWRAVAPRWTGHRT
jgi:hypothetical protein